MKVSLKWLQNYFDKPLPSRAAVVEAFTFHAFEIEDQVPGESDDLLDIKVLPNRAADCLSHRGIAKELAAILNRPLTNDPLSTPPEYRDPISRFLDVTVEDGKKCARYMGAVVKGVKVGPSPIWLSECVCDRCAQCKSGRKDHHAFRRDIRA